MRHIHNFSTYIVILLALLSCGCGGGESEPISNLGQTGRVTDSGIAQIPDIEPSTGFTIRAVISVLPRSLPSGSQYVRGTGLASGEVLYQEILALTNQVSFEGVPEEVDTFRLEFAVGQKVYGIYEESIDPSDLQDNTYTITDPAWEELPLAVGTLENIAVSQIRDMSVVDSNTVWLVGDRGTLLKSEDGGLNFQFRDLGTELDLRGVSFLDQQHGRIATGTNLIFSTSDGGETWVPTTVTPFVGHELSAVFYSSSAGGVLGGVSDPVRDRGTIYQTQDSGTAWTRTVFTTALRSEIDDFGGQTPILYASGQTGRFLKSIDDGATWASMDAGLPNSRLHSVDFESNNLTGYTLSGNNHIYYTSDGAATWQQANKDVVGSLGLKSVAVVDDGVAVAVGGPFDGSAVILRTVDAGVNWTRVQSSAPDTQLERVEFAGTTVGFAVSTDGIVLRTDDGGLTWSEVYDPTVELETDLLDVDIEGSLGAVVGQQGLLLRTNDGGQSFATSTFGRGETMWSVDFATSQLGFAAGGQGQIWRTLDGGDNWELVSTGFLYGNTTLRDLAAIDSQSIFSVGDSPEVGELGMVLKSGSGGRTWTRKDTGLTAGSFYGVSFADPKNGIVVGEEGLIATTSDGADNWIVRNSGTTETLNSVVFHSGTETAVAVGNSGTILKTDDSGATWNIAESGTSRDLVDVAFDTELSGICVGFDGTLLKTTDGGQTWDTMKFEIPYNLTSVALSLGSGGVMVGENGGISLIGSSSLELPSFVGPMDSTASSLTLVDSPVDGETLAVMEPVGLEVSGDSTSVRSVTVTLEVLQSHGPATLSGTTSRETFAGFVTFDDLVINQVGTYQLTFESSALASVTTQPFRLTDSSFGRFVGINGDTTTSATVFTYFDISNASGDDPADRDFRSIDFRRPLDLAASVSRNVLFVSDPNNDIIDRFPLDSSGTEDTTASIRNVVNPSDLQYDDETDRLFVVERSEGRIRVRDNASGGGQGDVTENRFVTGFTAPSRCRYTPSGDRLFVLDTTEDSVYIIDQASTAEGDITLLNPRSITGVDAFDIAYDRATDSLYFSFDETPMTVGVLETASTHNGPAVFGRTFTVATGRKKIALDEAAEVMYLMNPLQSMEAYSNYRSLSGTVTPDRLINQEVADGIVIRKEY